MSGFLHPEVTQPRHGVAAARPRQVRAYINSCDPQPLPDDACWYRDPSAALCVPCLDLVPVMNMGQPTLTIVRFLLALSFKVTALFLVFSVFFFSCAYKYILRKGFLIRVEGERGVIACALSNIWILLTIQGYEFLGEDRTLEVQ